jgi:hypothetical protein
MQVWVIIITMSLSSWARAGEPVSGHVLMSPEEQQIQVKAKKRLYPGGGDEDSLKVQSQLPQISRKMGGSTEAPEPEPADNSND